MKIILLILSLVAVSTAVPSAKDHWNSFKREHGKAYESPSEEQMRFTIFMDNLKMIEEHNAKYEAGLVSYHLKMNMFGDLRLEEAYALFNGFNKTGKLKERNQDTLTLSYEPEEDLYLPSSMDWRQKGAVTPVKDQGQCGGCWAFSTTGAMEGQLFKKTGKLVSLSEQQLIDCSDEDSGCGGGLMDNAFNYLQYSGGLASEQEYPFTGKDGECQFSESSAVRGTSVLRIVDISKGNEQALKKAVATAGPISIAVSAGNPGFLYYGGGVFYGETCNPSALDHGILAVGYGTQNGQDYWIVKNSWGPTWGEQGYIRLARNNDNTCGIASMASYPIL